MALLYSRLDGCTDQCLETTRFRAPRSLAPLRPRESSPEDLQCGTVILITGSLDSFAAAVAVVQLIEGASFTEFSAFLRVFLMVLDHFTPTRDGRSFSIIVGFVLIVVGVLSAVLQLGTVDFTPRHGIEGLRYLETKSFACKDHSFGGLWSAFFCFSVGVVRGLGGRVPNLVIGLEAGDENGAIGSSAV